MAIGQPQYLFNTYSVYRSIGTREEYLAPLKCFEKASRVRNIVYTHVVYIHGTRPK